MNTPYTSRRTRPCALGSACPTGRRIHRGDVAIRTGHRTYIHADDVPVVLDRFTRFLAAWTDDVVPVVQAWATHVVDVVSRHFDHVAAPILADMAQADAAHLVDLLWSLDVSVRPDPDHPGAVRIVAAPARTHDSPLHLPAVLATLGVQYDVVDQEPIPCRAMTIRLTPAYRNAIDLELTP